MALEGRVTYLDRMPEADAAYGRMPRTPRDRLTLALEAASPTWTACQGLMLHMGGCGRTASTIGRSAASRAEQASPSKMRPTLRG